MSPPLLTLANIHHSFGGTPCLAGADLSVTAQARICLVGRNGSGKSTLLKIAAGLIDPERGERFIHPGATIRYLPQEPDLSGFANTRAYVESGLQPADDTYRATLLLEGLGLTGDEPTAHLSGGEARRAALARVLAPEPDILLLDEPTNHLDLPAIEWLESTLASTRSALVLISHDRRFLQNLSRATVWLDRGVARRIDRGFEAFEGWRDEIYEQEERDRQKLDRKIAMEEDWLRYGVTARRKRNVRRLAGLHDLRRQQREAQGPVGDVKMTVGSAAPSGKLIIEAKSVGKQYGERVLVDGLSLRIARGDRLGIIGANGSGKTTLLNLLTGALAPDSGSVKIGDSVTMATLDQGRENIPPDATLAEAMTDGRGDFITVAGQSKHVMSYLKDFLFTNEQARTPVQVLSGGERGRLMLARAFARSSNMLVLDEPTNDLDLETLDLLQEHLSTYTGTVLLVSHDRDFLDRVCTSVLMAEPRGRWILYAGGYSDMLVQRGVGVTARRVVPAAGGPRKSGDTTGRESGPPQDAPRKKLSFKDRHALDTLPETIAALTRDMDKLTTALAEPDLYTRDNARFTKINAMLEAAQAKLAQLEDEWLRLELLRDELEGTGQ
jgi:ATP-binding cassette subfamily F protein uup